jgi:malonyl-CoA O-methyltransferase
MLQFSRSHRILQSAYWICADAESIPVTDNSIDVIFSSLAIQWCENVDALFGEVFRVLKPGGKFVFSTLGPNTLCELRQAWRVVDNYVHVNHFLPEDVMRRAITGAGLSIQAWQEKAIVLQYQKLTDLTRELKGLGAHNINAGRPEGLMGKQRIKAFRHAYEEQRDHQDKLPVSYQLWYAVISKEIKSRKISTHPQDLTNG